MAIYSIVYFGGDHPSDPKQAKQHFNDYKQWLVALGSAAISPANPLKGTVTLNADGSNNKGSASTMSGYTLVEAESLEQAIDMAQSCPFLKIGGSLEVSEVIDMPR